MSVSVSLNFALAGLLVWSIMGYAQAVEYIEVIVPVAVSEVSIPDVYNAAELDDYCFADWAVRQNQGV